jgi:hypothetical protein
MNDKPLICGARALAKANSNEDCYDTLDESVQQRLQQSVKAISLAMRKPSAAMIRAALTLELPAGRRLHEIEAMLVWERMIDAAVSEDLVEKGSCGNLNRTRH